jgi:hypothetical protein
MGAFASRTIYDPATAGLRRDIRRYTLIINIVGVFAVASCPFWLGVLFFTSPRDYSYTSSLVCVPLLAIVYYAAVAHVAQRNLYLKRLLSAGLVAHMAVSSVYLWMGFYVYGASVDAFHYWTVGGQLTRDFTVVGWSAFHPPYWNTNLINNICGIMMLLIGDGLPTLFITFALAAFWGGFLFYRAFEIAFPDGHKWLYGVLVMLLPSILFWSSSLGKDALAQLFIGVTSYGFARFCRASGASSGMICILGIVGMAAVRPHIAAMLAMGITVGYAFGKSQGGRMYVVARIFVIPLVLLGTFFLVRQAGQFVGIEGSNAQGGINKANSLTQSSDIGGSAFSSGQSLPVRIAEAPLLLFRPLPWEVHNAMAAASSIESTALLLLFWSRRRMIWSTIRQWRNPYTLFILVFCLLFSVAFAVATSNFGILVRERVMMVPIALMLVCAKPKSFKVRRLTTVRRSFLRVSAPIPNVDQIQS